MGKLVHSDREEVIDQVTKVSRDQFIERAADKAVKKIAEVSLDEQRIREKAPAGRGS